MSQSQKLGSMRSHSWMVVAGLLAAATFTFVAFHTPPVHGQAAPPVANDRLKLQTTDDPALGRVSRGTYTVFENRAAQRGRTIELAIVVLHARSATPKPDPIFFLAGGPGQDATTQTGWLADDWLRTDRDIVLVSQRGTGGSMNLACALPGLDGNIQGLIDPIFDERTFRDCLEQLKARADLTQYSTPIAMDDLNEVRAALGYVQINIFGGSYGTRAALVYMRQHPQTVRSAILLSPAPLSFTNPLFHAREAQAALNQLFEACAADPECAAAFPNLAAEFAAVIDRLARRPVEVEVRHPQTGQPTTVRLSHAAFADALRVLMYHNETMRLVPLLIHRASEGDFAPFAEAGIRSNGSLRATLAFGMLLCVTCAEDVARITEEAIVRETANTYLGDERVRHQKAICDFWPKSELPEDYAQPVTVNVPTLVISGTLDPVTSPRWGAETARHLPASKQITAPGAHDVGGECVDAIMREFLREASVDDLDTACLERMRLPRFAIE